jgi:hypothetical protein
MTDSVVLDVLKLGGGIAGIIALVWRLLESFSSYIQIGLDAKIEIGSRRVKFSTVIENKSYLGKSLEAAFLVIGPEREGPAQVSRSLSRLYPPIGDFTYLNDLVSVIARKLCRDEERVSGVFDEEGRAIVPLAYYRDENVDVGDERLTYTCSLELSRFPPGTYAVRFYVEPKNWWFSKRYFRSVQALFEVQSPEGDTVRDKWSLRQVNRLPLKRSLRQS